MYFCLSIKYLNMSKSKALSSLVSSFEIALKYFTVEELNNSLSKMLAKNSTETKKKSHQIIEKSYEIERLFKIIKSTYNISKNTFKIKYCKPHIQEIKQVVYCVLHIDLKIPMRKITEEIFDNQISYTLIFEACQRLKEVKDNIKMELEFKNKYTAIKEQLFTEK